MLYVTASLRRSASAHTPKLLIRFEGFFSGQMHLATPSKRAIHYKQCANKVKERLKYSTIKNFKAFYNLKATSFKTKTYNNYRFFF